MDYFSKLKKVAAQGMSLIQNVSQDIGLSVTSSADKSPSDDFIQRFQIICQIFDNLAKLESDVEAERILQESKIHGHIKVFMMHLHSEDKAWYLASLAINSNRKKDEEGDGENDNAEDDSDHPCFDVFLQNRYMDELCSRGRQDKPRGCLLLVLVMVTSILRNVRYPLLPYQTVHKSIYQLILDASSISSMYNSISKSKQSTSREFPSYVKKVDTSLVNLIASLWTKISDNPDLLNFFMFVDKRNGIKRHLDAISCLIPLMGKPKIGVIAKEALLTSISMHDSRIDSFILDETNLKVNIIAELQKKYQNCLAVLTLNIISEPISTGTSRPSQAEHEVTSTDKQVESFVKVLHFCAAVVATASSVSDRTSSIRYVMLKLFVDVFLKAVKSCLLENGEEQVLAAQSILRRMLLETFAAPGEKDHCVSNNINNSAAELLIGGFSRNINPLCTTITTFVCDDEEILQVLVRRVGSVSRSVSVSTIQLLSSLLSISSLSEACQLVISGSKGESLIRTATLTDSSSEINGSLDSFLLQYNMPSSNDISLGNYTKVSINHILGKLASSSESIYFDISPELSDDEFGPLFLVSFQKLQFFLSLKYDEQLAVTGLVNKCIIVLLASVLNSPSPAFILRVFRMLSKFFDSVYKLNTELNSHKANIPEVDAKFEIIRDVLAAPTSSDPHNRRIVEKENHQVVRILESCIIIDELINEMKGSVFAFKQLIFLSARTTSSMESDPDSNAEHALVSTSLLHEDSWSTDDEHADEHDDAHEDCLDVGDSIIISQDLTTDNFLLECENMEVQLEEVISSLSSSSNNA